MAEHRDRSDGRHPQRRSPQHARNLCNWATRAALRTAHTYLAYLFFATILLHVAAALFHGLVRRDGVFESMASWRAGPVHPT